MRSFYKAAVAVVAWIVVLSIGPLAVTRIDSLEVTNKIQMISGSGPTLSAGVGDPNGVLSSPIGSLWIQTDTPAVWVNTDGSTAWTALGAGGGGGGSFVPTLFGDGSDGALTFDGTSTVIGLVPVSNTYTLTRDVYCNGCTIDVGVTITGDYRMFDIGTLTLNGTIARDGNSGTGVTGGAARTTRFMISGGTNGGNGGSSAGGLAIGGGTANPCYREPTPVCVAGATAAGANGVSCRGGGGGSGASGLGATSGSVVLANRNLGAIPSGWQYLSGRAVNNTVMYTGTGGGGGRGDSTNVKTGGGGGGGGGYLFVGANQIVGTGLVAARGGAGADGEAGGNTGGGGGGAGGVVYVLTNGTCPTIDVSGGAGGAGQGTGTNGGAGSIGRSLCTGTP